MRARKKQPMRWGLVALAAFWMLIVVPLSAMAAPYAALVMDARSGEVLHSRNADTPLHPASLTKMMTLYIVFEAVENGEITLDTPVKISAHAASEPPSELGLRTGQSIRLRYLIRAAALKSANDASTALAEAIEGSEASFAKRMNRTARAMGMSRTNFKNAHGLTQAGHLSTARDMTILGRHLFFDYPDYYHLFSRIQMDAGLRTVYHTNRKLLRSYQGADGIKTGYTRAAGFNLTASARRGGEHIIATVFGGNSTASRNAKVAELLDMGFRRAPSRVALNIPSRPPYLGKVGDHGVPDGFGKKIRLVAAAAVKKSLRPQMRPLANDPPPEVDEDGIERALIAANTALESAEEVTVDALADVTEDTAQEPMLIVETTDEVTPMMRPEILRVAQAEPESEAEMVQVAITAAGAEVSLPENATEPAGDPVLEVVERISTSGGRHWGITVGRFTNEFQARKALVQIALNEISTLDGSRPKIREQRGGFDANFMGMSREKAEMACRRLQAKKITCFMIEPLS